MINDFSLGVSINYAEKFQVIIFKCREKPPDNLKNSNSCWALPQFIKNGKNEKWVPTEINQKKNVGGLFHA